MQKCRFGILTLNPDRTLVESFTETSRSSGKNSSWKAFACGTAKVFDPVRRLCKRCYYPAAVVRSGSPFASSKQCSVHFVRCRSRHRQGRRITNSVVSESRSLSRFTTYIRPGQTLDLLPFKHNQPSEKSLSRMDMHFRSFGAWGIMTERL